MSSWEDKAKEWGEYIAEVISTVSGLITVGKLAKDVGDSILSKCTSVQDKLGDLNEAIDAGDIAEEAIDGAEIAGEVTELAAEVAAAGVVIAG